MFKKILRANDGSTNAFDALSLAINLAKENGADLHMVSVEEVPCNSTPRAAAIARADRPARIIGLFCRLLRTDF